MREALSRLATSGFVVAEDQRGFRVADVSAAELTDITDTRIHVECEALRRAIAQGGLDWEERLAGAHYRLGRVALRLPDDSGLNPEWEQAHAAFHSALISGSGSNSLIAIAELLRDQTARYRHLSVAGASGSAPAPGRDVAREHRELLEATLARATRSAPRTCWPSICAAPPSWCWRTRRGNGARARVSGAPSPAGQRLMIIV